jgi:hypothetical protein
LGLDFIMVNYHRFMGFYYAPFWIAWLILNGRGPRRGALKLGVPVPRSYGSTLAIRHSNPRRWSTDRGPSKIIQRQLCRSNAISKTWVRDPMPTVLGSWFPVHGPRRDDPGTPGQVSCKGMESVLSYGEVQNRPPRLNLVLSDSTTYIERFSVSATDKDPSPRLYRDQLLHASEQSIGRVGANF